MLRRFVGLVFSAVFVVAASSAVLAAEWKCTQVGGCSATNPQGQIVTMAKGDVVDTGAGWSVSRANGWQPN